MGDPIKLRARKEQRKPLWRRQFPLQTHSSSVAGSCLQQNPELVVDQQKSTKARLSSDTMFPTPTKTKRSKSDSMLLSLPKPPLVLSSESKSKDDTEIDLCNHQQHESPDHIFGDKKFYPLVPSLLDQVCQVLPPDSQESLETSRTMGDGLCCPHSLDLNSLLGRIVLNQSRLIDGV